MILIGARHSKGRRNISVAFKWPIDISWWLLGSSNFPPSDIRTSIWATFVRTRANFISFAGMSDTFRHLWGQGDFLVSYSGIPRENLDIVIQEVLWSIRGSYSAILSLPLKNVKWHYDPSPTVTSQLSIDFMTLIPSLTFTKYWVVSMEHLQRMLYASRERLPFRAPGSVPPFWDLLVLQLLMRTDSSNLPCLKDNYLSLTIKVP